MPLRDVTWVLTTGEAGMRSQAFGLAEAVGLPVEEKRIVVAPWFAWLPGGLLPMPASALASTGDPLTSPWPSLVVGCGRRSIGAALRVRRLSGGRTLAAYVQNPEWGQRHFDLVAAMPHDGVIGSNVVLSPTALHPITPRRLQMARETWRVRLVSDSRPILGVLVGGDNSGYRLTPKVAAQLVRILKAARHCHGMRSVITPSRRTPNDVKRLLQNAAASEELGWIWDETGENPYSGILALSDRLIVTAESISMISEALATGHPVHVLPLMGHGKRHDAFLDRVIAEKLVSPIEGDDLDWNFAGPGPIASTTEPAERIKAMLKSRPVG
jgi:mitochondrial fission protein ELM1